MSHKSPLESLASGIIEIAWRSILICAGIYVILIGVERAYSFGHGLLYDHAMEAAPGTEVSLEITIMDNRDSVGRKLLREGLIDNLDAYQLQSRLYKTELEPGVYTLDTTMKLSEILKYLTEEGKKLAELKEKNLVTETSAAAEESSDVIGGNEDAADHVVLPEEAEGAELVGGGDEAN